MTEDQLELEAINWLVGTSSFQLGGATIAIEDARHYEALQNDVIHDQRHL